MIVRVKNQQQLSQGSVLV